MKCREHKPDNTADKYVNWDLSQAFWVLSKHLHFCSWNLRSGTLGISGSLSTLSSAQPTLSILQSSSPLLSEVPFPHLCPFRFSSFFMCQFKTQEASQLHAKPFPPLGPQQDYISQSFAFKDSYATGSSQWNVNRSEMCLLQSSLMKHWTWNPPSSLRQISMEPWKATCWSSEAVW